MTQSQPNPQSPTTTTGAPLWRRFAALGYDILVLGGVSMGYGAVTTLSVAVFVNHLPQDYAPMLHGPLFFIGWLLVILAFYAGFWLKSGQTLGMRAWQLRLITLPTAPHLPPPSLQQVLLRCALGVASLLCFGAGYWYRWSQASGDCWHDKISGTRVIHIR